MGRTGESAVVVGEIRHGMGSFVVVEAVAGEVAGGRGVQLAVVDVG